MWDLVFPLFLFMSGVSMPYSIMHQKKKGISRNKLHQKVFKRMLILVAIGLSFTAFHFQPEIIKLYTVLFLIGVGNYIGSLVIIYRDKKRSHLFWAVGMLIGYQLATYFISYPGQIEGVLLPGNHLAGIIDQHLLPTALYMDVFDPEGTIRVIPAGVICILGALVGSHIKSYPIAKLRCGIEVFAMGLITMLLGVVWGEYFPIIKSIWSSSFVLFTAGISMMLLSLFYLIIDVWKQKWLGFLFIPIGMNSILIYAGVRYINFRYTSEFFLSGLGHFFGENWHTFIVIFGTVAIEWCLLYFLYRKRVFLKV
jgi:predicted acyltransferase